MILGVVKLAPVAKAVPPVAAAYQDKVPAEAVAPSVTVPALQRAAGVVEATVGVAVTVIYPDSKRVSVPL